MISVIEDGPRIVGFLAAGSAGNEWEIENLVIAADMRRRGLAGKLLTELLHQASKRGAIEVFLEVRESNATARRFYEKWSFEEIGRRKKYYQQPQEDAVIYRCKPGFLPQD